jgi:hypothetical protein
MLLGSVVFGVVARGVGGIGVVACVRLDRGGVGIVGMHAAAVVELVAEATG